MNRKPSAQGAAAPFQLLRAGRGLLSGRAMLLFFAGRGVQHGIHVLSLSCFVVYMLLSVVVVSLYVPIFYNMAFTCLVHVGGFLLA